MTKIVNKLYGGPVFKMKQRNNYIDIFSNVIQYFKVNSEANSLRMKQRIAPHIALLGP